MVLIQWMMPFQQDSEVANKMGVIILLIVLALISFIFVRAALFLRGYYKKLYSPETNISITFQEKYSRWYVYMKSLLSR